MRTMGSAGEVQGSGVVDAIAANVRRLRDARGLSLGALAASSGVGKATLSRIESGRTNPTVETLYALADTLRVPVVEILADARPGDHVMRVGDGSTLTSDAGSTVRMLTRVYGVGLAELVEVVFPAGCRREAQPHAPGVVEHLLMISGHLLAGPVDDLVELGPGDLRRFRGDIPHAYVTQGDEPARTVELLVYPS